MMPQRIQLRRTKGWRKPEGAVVVSRPSKWGNEFAVGSPGVPTRQLAVEMYRAALAGSLVGLTPLRKGWMPTVADVRAELAGKDLACWCPLDQPCHADALLAVANGGEA